MPKIQGKISDIEELREKEKAYNDRSEAGRMLASQMGDLGDSSTLLLAIPSGGIPVGIELARELNLEIQAAVVSKIGLPWDAECGYGAVAWDGSVIMGEDTAAIFHLSDEQIARGIEATRAKVARRTKLFYGETDQPDVADRRVVLVDDGIATGLTISAAVKTVRQLGAREVLIASPTGHRNSVMKLARETDGVYCPNIRSGGLFAVASAYVHWSDLDEREAADMLRQFRQNQKR